MSKKAKFFIASFVSGAVGIVVVMLVAGKTDASVLVPSFMVGTILLCIYTFIAKPFPSDTESK